MEMIRATSAAVSEDGAIEPAIHNPLHPTERDRSINT
jgi:hypothetical protein